MFLSAWLGKRDDSPLILYIQMVILSPSIGSTQLPADGLHPHLQAFPQSLKLWAASMPKAIDTESHVVWRSQASAQNWATPAHVLQDPEKARELGSRVSVGRC